MDHISTNSTTLNSASGYKPSSGRGSTSTTPGYGSVTPEEVEETVQLMKAIELEEKTKTVNFKWVNGIE
jgi:hypothetical protein